MDNNFKFKTRHVSIVQRSFSVVNSFTSSFILLFFLSLTCGKLLTTVITGQATNLLKTETMDKIQGDRERKSKRPSLVCSKTSLILFLLSTDWTASSSLQ